MNRPGSALWKIPSRISGRTNVRNPPSKPRLMSTSALASAARRAENRGKADVHEDADGDAKSPSPAAAVDATSSRHASSTHTSSNAELTPSPKYGFTV